MTIDRIIVTVLGCLAILSTLWYFFRSHKTDATETGTDGYQEVQVRVKGGYTPDVILIRRDRPLRIQFLREETSSCSDTVVFPDFGIRAELPAYRATTIELIPDRSGEYSFTCGMGMLKGRLIVE